MIELVIGALISIVSIVLGFVLNVVYENSRKNRERRNESLKNHFKQLETSVIKPVSEIVGSVKNSEGSLSIKGASHSSPSYATLTGSIGQGEFGIFKSHFPDLAEKVSEQLNKVHKHNEIYESFTNKLGCLIEEKTDVPVTRGGERPFIYSDVRYYLRKTLNELAKGESLTFDFQEATIEKLDKFWRVSIRHNICAEVRTEAEANQCKRGLIELMELPSLREKMSCLLNSATEVENESKSIADLLDFTCWQYRESTQLLSKQEDCPYCQVIFHPKKRRKNV